MTYYQIDKNCQAFLCFDKTLFPFLYLSTCSKFLKILLILLILSGYSHNNLPKTSSPPETEIYIDPFNTTNISFESICLLIGSKRLSDLKIYEEDWTKGYSIIFFNPIHK